MTHARATILAILALFVLASCGGGGGGGSAGVAPRGATVAIALTDAPATEYDAALATITSIELLGNGAPVAVFQGEETVDLLKLADYAELFAVAEGVPPGTYSKIRLRVTALKLVDRDTSGAIVSEVDADLVANGKLDLNPRGPFTLAAGDTLVISLDFDVAKSLKVTTTGSGRVIVRPVIFVDILPTGSGPLAKLARVHGTVDALYADGFRLCQTAIVAQGVASPALAPRERCVRVVTDDATGVFGPDGLPQVAPVAVGDPLTVVGRLAPLVAVPPSGGDPADRFSLLAFVVESGPLGTFDRLRGTAATVVNGATDRFGLELAPAQGIVTAAPLAKQLFPKSRIFSRAGLELARNAVQPGRRLVADGVLALGAGPSGEALLRSPLLVVELLPLDDALAGTVQGLDAITESLILATATGDRCVDAASADIFLAGTVGDRFESRRGEFADLVDGQQLTAFGTEGVDGCLVAATIIAAE